MDDKTQYESICKGEFADIKSDLSDIKNRLFIDNGAPSMQTRLDRNERMLKVALWIICVVCAASIAQTTKAIVNKIVVPHDKVAVEE